MNINNCVVEYKISSDPSVWPSTDFDGLNPTIVKVESTYQIHPTDTSLEATYVFYLLVSIDSGATFYAYPGPLTLNLINPIIEALDTVTE